MFKNSVLRKEVDTFDWFKKASIRAVKTFAQTFASMITVGATLQEIEWKYVISVSVVSLIYSVATSVAGIEEAKRKEK